MPKISQYMRKYTSSTRFPPETAKKVWAAIKDKKCLVLVVPLRSIKTETASSDWERETPAMSTGRTGVLGISINFNGAVG
jgi:hypothetical protein